MNSVITQMTQQWSPSSTFDLRLPGTKCTYEPPYVRTLCLLRPVRGHHRGPIINHKLGSDNQQGSASRSSHSCLSRFLHHYPPGRIICTAVCCIRNINRQKLLPINLESHGGKPLVHRREFQQSGAQLGARRAPFLPKRLRSASLAITITNPI